MNRPRCLRCGDPFEPREVRQRDCVRCIGEVTRAIEADTKRRTPRFPGVDFTGRIYA